MSEPRKVTNTTKQMQENPSPIFGLPGMIEASEAQGQRELVNSDQLPVQMSKQDREHLESLGVQFGEPTKDDPIFCDVVLPAGWKKEPTDHSMWSNLVDEKGTVIASIFYKAAFYDRDAFLRLAK